MQAVEIILLRSLPVEKQKVLFEILWELYEEAFPVTERRLKEDLYALIPNPNFYLTVLYGNDKLIGLLFYWNLSSFVYIEHFACFPCFRRKGFGTEVLKQFIQQQNKPIVLEVEPPLTEEQVKRIFFYERLGFKLNDFYYQQPPYQKSCPPIELKLMSHPQRLDVLSFHSFIMEYHPLVYKI